MSSQECSCEWLLPLTSENIVHYYIPFTGASCYTIMGTHILRPGLFFSLGFRRDPTNLLLAGSIIGTGVYLKDRKFLSNLVSKKRIGYSLFNAAMFNFGSLLLWAILKSGISHVVKGRSDAPLKVLTGIASSIFLLMTGIEYTKAIENQVPEPDQKKSS